MPQDSEPTIEWAAARRARTPSSTTSAASAAAPEGSTAPGSAIGDGVAARRDAYRSARVEAHLTRLDAALRAAAARFYAGDVTPDPALHAAVCAAVDALRGEGAAILTTLRVVKARLAGARPQGLRDDAVRWSIARYYAAAGDDCGAGGAGGRRA